jgi:hypothetical protein
VVTDAVPDSSHLVTFIFFKYLVWHSIEQYFEVFLPHGVEQLIQSLGGFRFGGGFTKTRFSRLAMKKQSWLQYLLCLLQGFPHSKQNLYTRLGSDCTVAEQDKEQNLGLLVSFSHLGFRHLCTYT